MATKAELEWQRTAFRTYVAQSKEALSQHQYSNAIELAIQSFAFIDGMIQYERRYEQVEDQPYPTIKTVLSYSPVLFRWKAIDEVERLLDSTKRIEKNSQIDWRAKIDHSRRLLGHALETWTNIHARNSATYDGDQNRRIERVFILSTWENMGYVTKPNENGDLHSFVSNMEMRTRAKCKYCGDVCDATKATFLADIKCLKCGVTNLFVILGPVFRKAK
ncbi:MAG: hypothetical protein QM703_25170 [Gemmatales bacterium]